MRGSVWDQRRHDDCLRACVATVLGIAYDDTLSIEPDAVENDEFWSAWVDWAEARGDVMWFFHGEQPIHLDRWIASVPSLTMPGKQHVVVMRRTGLFDDPCRTTKREFVSPSDVTLGIAFESCGAVGDR